VVENQPIDLLHLLADRLERLSVDSRWARRASGLRGNLLKVIEQQNLGEPIAKKLLEQLTDTAFEILRQAAQDIPNQEELSKKNRASC
jgi:hypothetical protein